MARPHGLCILVACLPPLAAGTGGCARPAQERAIAEIERLEGKFEMQETASRKSLVKVDLSFTQASDASLARLTGVTTLQELHLCGTKITNMGLKHVSGLTSLRVLDCWRCKNLTDAGLEHLAAMPHLQRLSLWNTNVTDDGLGHLKGLTSLRVLDLSHTRVSDAGLKQLEGLTSLQELALVGCDELTDAGIDALQKALPNVVISR